jgi:hypothetical protein
VKRKVSWQLQSRGEIAIENAVFFRFLVEQVGSKIANDWIRAYLNRVDSEILAVGKPNEIITKEVEMLRVAGGLTFWPFLNDHKSTSNPKDPINVIFWRRGAISYIADLLRNRVGGWASTPGVALYALIDDTLHGGSITWKKFDEQLRKGPFSGTSFHVRLYGGMCSCNHGKEVYALGGVHEEQLLNRLGPIPWHVPISWDNARNDLEADVQSITGAAASVTQVFLVSPGTLQQVSYDGLASYIELALPPWMSAVP